MPETIQRDLTKSTLAIVLIGALLAACFWILRPFLPALIWAAMIVIATWPLLLIIQKKVHGRRPAVMIVIGLLVLVFVIPFTLAVGTIAENAPQITALSKELVNVGIPAPPDWVDQIPLVGKSVAEFWQKTSTTAPEELTKRLSPYMRNIGGWLVAQAGSFGLMFLHLLLTLILASILYMNGEDAAKIMLRLSHRIAGERGEHATNLAALSVRAVAQGVVVTALAQSLLAGIGLAVVGIPYASLLTALIFMLTIAQIGAGPVLIPAIIWLFWSGSTGWGIAMLIWSIFVMGMDGFLRPYLIRRNANLPLLLIFAGVIGGLISFGVIGLFIGPVLLAVCYTLMLAWINEENNEETTT
ncbi:AI-2E family transporter YdiK [Deltaproteobacteria bacterium IMCC39524]|nr:AI-2E family transporter YdiK [Deltaproteobacteria bacterium IMCC39524]